MRFEATPSTQVNRMRLEEKLPKGIFTQETLSVLIHNLLADFCKTNLVRRSSDKELGSNKLELMAKESILMIKFFYQSFGLVLLLMITLLLNWTFVFRRVISGLVLIFDVPIYSGTKSDKVKLENYLLSRRFDLDTSNKIIVLSGRTPLKLKRFSSPLKNFYCLMLLLSLLDRRYRFEYTVLLIKRTWQSILWIKIFPRHYRYLVLLLLEEPIGKVLTSSKKIDAIVTTNSQYLRQHAIFQVSHTRKSPRSIMIWYSENSIPKKLTGQAIGFDYSHFREMQVKEHFVWTEHFATFLRQFVNGAVSAVGEIILPARAYKTYTKEKIDVLILDVTPRSKAAKSTFYSADRTVKFLQDIESVVEKVALSRPISVALKPKRPFGPNDDPKYILMVKNFAAKNPRVKFTLLNPKIELSSLLDSTSVVVGIPYTSALLICNQKETARFYYMGDTQFEASEMYQSIPIIRDLEALYERVAKSIGVKYGPE
jgi:hypothetical protein